MSSNGIRTKANYFYATISVALVLFLLGFFGLTMIHANKLIQSYKENINLIVEIENGASTKDIDSIKKYLNKQRYTKKASVQLITKAQAIKILSEDLGEDLLEMDVVNPLYDVVQFNIKSNYLHQEQLHTITNNLKKLDFVNDVYYKEDLVAAVADNLNQLALIAMVLGLLFIFVAISLIHNTVRLALYANRFLIKNMQLVGASWEFISKPYLVRSLKSGLISASIAIGLLSLILLLVQQRFPASGLIEDITSLSIIFIGLIALGILITGLSTYFIVHKYLTMRLGDLY